MNGELSQNAQAILLLTAPLLAGGSRPSVRPLPLGDYNNLVRYLRDTGMEPEDLLDSEGLRELGDSWSRLRTRRTLEDVRRLLGRGFLLAQALERWSALAIWVVTRPDDGYPDRLRKKMRGKAPPVLYGCGDRGALDVGGLAVVGSRKVNEELVEYTERVGRLAAEAEVPVVSGGARGVDQAAMRGSLEAGGRAIGVLGNNLERAALDRGNREPLMDGRLVLVSSFDPAVRFRGWQAMERNKQIYALADAGLVVNSDHGHGGTWAGATEQLGPRGFGYVPVYVRSTGEPSRGLDELVALGAGRWPEPETRDDLRGIVFDDASRVWQPAGPPQGELFRSEHAAPGVSVVRESGPTVLAEGQTAKDDPESPTEAPVPGKNEMRLLRVSGEMTRKEICDTLKLKNWSYAKKRYVDPFVKKGWIRMTMPEKPRSPKQRFLITPDGRACVEASKDE